jgi:hypothetical protein
MNDLDSAPRHTGQTQGSSAPLVPHIFVARQGRPRGGLGFFGSVLVGLVFVLGLMLFLVALALIAVVFVAAIVVAVVALGINRLMMTLSPRYRKRRQVQGGFQPTVRVIETTAKVIDSTKPKRRT